MDNIICFRTERNKLVLGLGLSENFYISILVHVFARKLFLRRTPTMKKIKNIVAASLASVLMCTNAVNASAASIPDAAIDIEQVGLDNIDVILASHYYLASYQDDENFWPDDLSDIEIVPLYDTEGEISSYYVELADNAGYAVINNNVENPTAIEFGAGNNPQIREILDSTADPHIIYNNPVSLYNLGEIAPLSLEEDMPDIYDNYPDLREPDIDLANTISQYKLLLESTPMPYGDGDYGFINSSDMPTGSRTTNYISGYSVIQWVSTGETSAYASNHCGSVAVTNLALYFAKQKPNLMVNNDRIETFKAVHKVVGNGPKMTIADEAVDYFKAHEVTLNFSTNRNIDMTKRIAAENTAIDKGRPCALLLQEAMYSWHWILAVGYRNYTEGGKYFQIVDGWSNNATRYYKPGVGSVWVSMTEYWV